MYQVLARKWRPKKFQDVIGQDHITRTLINSIKNEKVAHAYLFTGTRGVGKTTIARIFAKTLKCENRTDDFNPCGECSSCKSIDSSNSLDYVEIDGASNNGVDKIRELIDNVQYLPVSGKYKVYVIDEVHMLSTGAFNALLKTLEEPPAHVVFIFATTDPHKLLGTVLSRCQRFDFKSVDEENLVNQLKKISASENINFENQELIKIIAKHGDGSVRDTLSLLDQVISLSSSDVVKQDELYQSLGLINQMLVDDIIVAILSKDNELFKDSIKQLKSQNLSYEKFLDQLLDGLYTVINNLDNENFTDSDRFKSVNFSLISTAEVMWIYETLIKDSTWIFKSFDIMRSIEFLILKIVRREEILNLESKKKKINSITIESEQIKKVEEPIIPKEELIAAVGKEEVEEVKPQENIKEKNWTDFFEFARLENKAISVNLERAIHDENFNYDNVWLRFSNEDKIFKDFLCEPNHYSLLIEIIAKYANVSKAEVHLKIEIVDEETILNENLMNKVEKDELSEIQNKEMLENQIKSNKFIRQAQDLFNTKISKIVLNTENKD